MRWIVLALAAVVVGGAVAQGAPGGKGDEAAEDEKGWLTHLLERLGVRKWQPLVELEVLDVTTNRTKIGGWGDTVEADPGHVFVEVRVLARNNGTVPLALSTWHFRAEDEHGRSVSAEVSMAHHDFDGSALHPGAERVGLLLFEVREGTQLHALAWSGEIAHARVEMR